MKEPSISIIIPKYKPKKELIERLRKYLRENAKEAQIIEVEGEGGLAHTYNEGIKKSKGEIIITLHQDCVPLERDAINKLVKPFRNSQVVFACSLILDESSRKKYFPFAPDGKFTAYRRSALEKVGLFDEKTFFTGGEDVDIYIKLKRIGRLAKVNTLLIHSHPNYLGNKTLEKRKQNGSINGTLFRRWGFHHPLWWKSIIAACVYPFSYGRQFVKAFFTGKQKYRRKD